MSGHSKWSTIKRKKGAADAKRGQLFTKLGREIQIAARDGADPESNFRLRLAVEKARMANMPKENIERAIRRGAGMEKTEALEEITYEGYGPHGVAMLVRVVTDNRNRAVADVRRVFSRAGGSLGETGCVAWLFEPKGYITISPNDTDPEQIAMMAIDAGADDFTISENMVEVYTTPEGFSEVRRALQEQGLNVETAELSWIPKTLVTLDEKQTLQNMTLIENLEELEDVAAVYSNLDISDEMIARFEQ